MRKKLLSILALTILLATILAGCGQASSTPPTLTILSITEGHVLVMKAGADDWTEATVGMSLEVGDTIKTGDDSGAEITFFDGSTIELEAGTQIEIASLDSSPDTGTKTITLMQTIGTTISRVTKLLDPASTYAIETPTGVAAVRGSTMIVRIIFNDPNYADGTILITNLEGHIWAIWQGVELQVPEGRTCVIRPGQLPELIPLNNPPVAASDSAVTDADSSITVDAPGVLVNDSDPDGDTLAVTAVDTSGTVGTVTAWGPDGSFTYDPDGQFEYLPAGNSTSDSFTYTVSDGNGGTDTATVTVIINGVYNQPVNYPPVYYPPVNYPPVAVDDSATTPQDTPVTINILSNDFDPDNDTLTVASVTQGAHGSVTNNGNNVTYTPALNFTGTDSFTYTISDGNGGTDTAIVTVTVTSINHPPVAVDDNATTPQDTPVTINILSNDSDPDAGDTLTVNLVTPGTHGSVTINGSNVTYTPNSGFTGTDSFTYTISDGNDGTDTATVTITVASINHPPVAVDDSATTLQDTPVTINVLSNDSDPDAGDTLTVNSVTQGSHGSVTNNGSNVTYTPALNFTGTDSFAYTVNDGNGGTDTATVTVTVAVAETPAYINVQADQANAATIYIYDDTTDGWVSNGDYETPGSIAVAVGHYYYVWVGGNVTYDVQSNHLVSPSTSALDGGGQKAYGCAAASKTYSVHFTQTPS